MDLYQYSIDNGSVFSAWKTTILTAIYKDDETEIANYRPVSLLTIPSKILKSEAYDIIVITTCLSKMI